MSRNNANNDYMDAPSNRQSGMDQSDFNNAGPLPVTTNANASNVNGAEYKMYKDRLHNKVHNGHDGGGGNTNDLTVKQGYCINNTFIPYESLQNPNSPVWAELAATVDKTAILNSFKSSGGKYPPRSENFTLNNNYGRGNTNNGTMNGNGMNNT